MASFDEVIPPGQAGKVSAAVRTEGLTGSVSKIVTVTTDDSARPTFMLTLRATIVASVDFFPTRGMFIAVGAQDGGTGKLLVRKSVTEKGDLEVSGLSATAPWIKVSARKVAAAEPATQQVPPAMAADWVIEASVAGEPADGQSAAEVRFKTGLAREPEASFPVTVRVLPALSLATPTLYLASPAGPAEASRGTTYVQVRPGLDGTNLTVEAMPSAFKVATERVAPQRFKVDVTWTPAGDATPREGAVVVKLGPASTSMAVRVNPPPIPVAAPPPAPSPPQPPPHGGS